MEIVCGIVFSLMVYFSMWLTPDGYVQTLSPHFFIDLIWILSLWINYLQILQNVVLDNLSCFCKLSFLELFLQIVNDVVPLDSFQILQIIIPHKILKIILTGNFFENSTNLVPDKSLQII